MIILPEVCPVCKGKLIKFRENSHICGCEKCMRIFRYPELEELLPLGELDEDATSQSKS